MWWLHPLSSRGEGFYGGIGGDIGEYAIFVSVVAALVGAYRLRNCHVHRCPRLAWHVHPEHGHPVCKRHHPDGQHERLDASTHDYGYRGFWRRHQRRKDKTHAPRSS